jgi:hypothetical protein
MYTEFVACYEASRQAEWFKKFISGLRVVNNIEKPLKIHCDNEPAVQYSYSNKKCDDVKHINIKYYVVKEKIQDHTISLEHIRLTTQCVQGACSRHGFKGKPMILGY